MPGLAANSHSRAAFLAEPNVAYHYAYALNESGNRARAEEILSKLLAVEQKFDALNDARALQRRLTQQPDENNRLKF